MKKTTKRKTKKAMNKKTYKIKKESEEMPMKRKQITQIFPFLIPLRQNQRKFFYQISMFLDKNKYARKRGEILPYEVSSTKTLMINENSGYDILYQYNKVHNLKVASKTMNQILIRPGETFSFYNRMKKAWRYGKYKDGLITLNGKTVPIKSGGLCHLSNMLHYLFLMSPMTVTERHGHKIKSLPNPDKDSLEGIDATINGGWLDLRVKNETKNTYQILISFDEKYMYGKILSDEECLVEYMIKNEDFKYLKKDEEIYESVSIIREEKNKKTKKVEKRETLYQEVVKVDYELPKNTKIEEEKK